jgi:hypothetical protein
MLTASAADAVTGTSAQSMAQASSKHKSNRFFIMTSLDVLYLYFTTNTPPCQAKIPYYLASANKVCYNNGIPQGGDLLPQKIQIKQNEKERKNEALRTCLL